MGNDVSESNDVIKSPLYCIGDIVRHKHFPFRGVIVDVDPVFDNTDEWYDSCLLYTSPSPRD